MHAGHRSKYLLGEARVRESCRNQVLPGVQIKIFSLDGPVRSEGIFNAAASSPSVDGGGGSSIERNADDVYDSRANIHRGATGFCVHQYTIPSDAHTAAIERVPIANRCLCESISQPKRVLQHRTPQP